MKSYIKSRVSGSILSDGSFKFVLLSHSQQALNLKKVDINNHSIWTGRRPEEQTEISAFIARFALMSRSSR